MPGYWSDNLLLNWHILQERLALGFALDLGNLLLQVLKEDTQAGKDLTLTLPIIGVLMHGKRLLREWLSRHLLLKLNEYESWILIVEFFSSDIHNTMVDVDV